MYVSEYIKFNIYGLCNLLNILSEKEQSKNNKNKTKKPRGQRIIPKLWAWASGGGDQETARFGGYFWWNRQGKKSTRQVQVEKMRGFMSLRFDVGAGSRRGQGQGQVLSLGDWVLAGALHFCGTSEGGWLPARLSWPWGRRDRTELGCSSSSHCQGCLQQRCGLGLHQELQDSPLSWGSWCPALWLPGWALHPAHCSASLRSLPPCHHRPVPDKRLSELKTWSADTGFYRRYLDETAWNGHSFF